MGINNNCSYSLQKLQYNSSTGEHKQTYNLTIWTKSMGSRLWSWWYKTNEVQLTGPYSYTSWLTVPKFHISIARQVSSSLVIIYVTCYLSNLQNFLLLVALVALHTKLMANCKPNWANLLTTRKMLTFTRADKTWCKDFEVDNLTSWWKCNCTST